MSTDARATSEILIRDGEAGPEIKATLALYVDQPVLDQWLDWRDNGRDQEGLPYGYGIDVRYLSHSVQGNELRIEHETRLGIHNVAKLGTETVFTFDPETGILRLTGFTIGDRLD